jgi:methyl-accepting chemotaxis protein
MEQYGSQISEVFSGFLRMARDGETSSRKLDETNRQITHSSNEILSVITIIEEFFDKIKMLSLNATIEAARAGEYGRGFAVVASEIGKLSEDSAKELTQINELIQRNNSDVESGNVVITEILRLSSRCSKALPKCRRRPRVFWVKLCSRNS